MADIIILSNKNSSLLIAKTAKSRLHFNLTYQDLSSNSEGDLFITRSREAGDDIKRDCIALGMDIQEK